MCRYVQQFAAETSVKSTIIYNTIRVTSVNETWSCSTSDLWQLDTRFNQINDVEIFVYLFVCLFIISLTIVKYFTLLSLTIDKLNLRLVRTSQYFSQFSLNIRHRVDKLNIVSDVLLRLAIIVEQNDDLDENILHEIDVYVDDTNILIVIRLVKHIARKRNNVVATNIVDDVVFFHACLIQMSNEFKKRLNDVYVKLFKWTKIMNTTQKSSLFSSIQFSLNDDLIYYTNFANRKKLCLFKKFKKEIFEQTHENNNHVEFNRIYEIIIINFYFRKLSNRLHRYIVYCHQCNLCQTKRHALYDNLNFIVSSSILFYIVCFDFILVLSKHQEMNVALMTTCKFSKKFMIMMNKNTYSVKNWINVIIDDLVDWEMSRAFIHDKNKKFLFVFWKRIFKKLNVQFLVFVVYHS